MTLGSPTAWLDGVLGRVTMYRLVLYGLAVLFVAALVFTGLGVVSPGADVVGMLVSAIALVGVGLLANRLFALVFRVRPHTESALITAGLLFFILPPRSTPDGVAILALAAVIAMASKYLLAIRGRHVFNPAALAAFVIGLSTLSFGAWWVGTPWLLPFAAVLAFLILFRTRRLPMGGVFVAVGLLVGTAQYAFFGLPIAQAAQLVVLSSPLVFFAGFMITEPLTLPPRRWQQLAYAALVATLYYVTYAFGPIHNSPEFALLVGNLLAFLAGQRRGIRLEFVERRQLSPSSWEFDFRAVRPVRFRPGQFAELSVPHAKTDSRGWRRVFSIASAPGDVLRFGIRLPERASSFKRALLALEPGAHVSATGVGGDFLLPGTASTPLLLVAGGIGITPFVGHLEEAAAAGEARDIAVVYAVSSLDDLAYADRLRAAGCRVAVASPARPDELPVGWSWIGPDRLSGDALLAAVPDAARRAVYLSGPPSMVAALKRTLRRAGVRRIHTDVFVGY
jgi:Flavodoxin reductases (ferredoxin-NADPH reductases) family 1